MRLIILKLNAETVTSLKLETGYANCGVAAPSNEEETPTRPVDQKPDPTPRTT